MKKNRAAISNYLREVIRSKVLTYSWVMAVVIAVQFSCAAQSGMAGGSNTQVQYNDQGTSAGSPLSYNKLRNSFSASVSPSGRAGDWYTGLTFTPWMNGTEQMSQFAGAEFDAYYEGTGSAGMLMGTLANTNLDSGSATQQWGTFSIAQSGAGSTPIQFSLAASHGIYDNNTGFGTVTKSGGLYVFSPVAEGGVISHNYGIYIEDQTTGALAINPDPWGLYVAGGKVYTRDALVLGSESGPRLFTGSGTPSDPAPLGSEYIDITTGNHYYYVSGNWTNAATVTPATVTPMIRGSHPVGSTAGVLANPGAPGPQGPAGPQGATGPSTYQAMHVLSGVTGNRFLNPIASQPGSKFELMQDVALMSQTCSMNNITVFADSALTGNTTATYTLRTGTHLTATSSTSAVSDLNDRALSCTMHPGTQSCSASSSVPVDAGSLFDVRVTVTGRTPSTHNVIVALLCS